MPKNSYIQRTQTVRLPDGSTKRLKAYGSTEKEAIKKLAKLVAEYEAGKLFITKATSFERYAESYVDTYKKPQIDSVTLSGIKRLLKLHFYPLIGAVSLERLTASAVQQCLNTMQEQGLSQDYIKKAYNLAYAILEQARKDRLLLYNIVENCTKPAGKKPQPRRALTEDERQWFLKACDRSPKGVIYMTSYYCGLRPAEVRALRWENVSFKERTISVTNRVDAKGTIKPPKSKAGLRTVPIPDALFAALAKLPRNINQDAFVFTGDTKPQTKQNYERGWDYIKRLMDIEAGAELYRNQIIKSVIDTAISPYYLRHTYCTRLAEAGVPLKTAQYLMGHASIEMTADIYTHITPKLLAESESLIKSL